MRVITVVGAMALAILGGSQAVAADPPTTIQDPSLMPDWFPGFEDSGTSGGSGEKQPNSSKNDPVSPDGLTDPELQALIGTRVTGALDIPGWEDMGGGLLEGPVWFSQYGRGDGAHLVLFQWALPRQKGSPHLPLQITDLLTVPALPQGQLLALFCHETQPNVTRKVLAVARADPDREMWRDIRQAWVVSLDTGEVASIAPSGIACYNESWGN